MIQRKLNISSENWSEEPFTIARESSDNFDVVVVELEQDGVKGWGECSPITHYEQSAEQTVALIESFRTSLETGLNRTELQTKMQSGAARNAVDCALWDLESKLISKNKSKKIRVWELPELSKQAVIKMVTTVYTLSVDVPEKMGEVAKQNAFRPVLKIKLTGDGDLERLQAIRENAPNSSLVVDANESWEPQHYENFIPEFIKLNVKMVEQPFPANNDGILKSLERPITVCADESCHVTSDLDRLVGLYDMINIKLDKTGGLTEALILQAEAEKRGFLTMVGCMSSTSLGIAPAFLIAQRAEIVDLDAPLYLYEDRLSPMKYEGSIVSPPESELWG